MNYDDFAASVLPGNYALTKSMELTKSTVSGTLWYTKKFLTLYYFVFLSNELMTTAYSRRIVEIFDGYIQSLDASVQDDARTFFYSDNAATDPRSEQFNLFCNFASYNTFQDNAQREEYYQKAKKYYFALLMGSGGQGGTKKKLKEELCRPGFVFSNDNIRSAIYDAAVNSLAENANAHSLKDNSLKYIFSDRTLTAALDMAEGGVVTRDDIIMLDRRYPHDEPKYAIVQNDVIAFIRNERQVLYYYGFFHSKSSGATDFEFSSLTPIGELALNANALEFAAIWEHQKLKMVSQPVTAIINNLGENHNAESFGISYNPYLDILGHLSRHGSLSIDEYKYIVSRKKHWPEAEWIECEDEIMAHLGDIKTKVDSFGRERDRSNDDGRKELLKYLLGLRSDMPLDKEKNPLGIVKWTGSKATVESDKLALLTSVYSRLGEYKVIKYGELLSRGENELRSLYIARSRRQERTLDRRIKIDWDLFNIRPDKFIMMGVIVAMSAVMTGSDEISVSLIRNRAFKENITKFSGLLSKLGYRTAAAITSEVHKVIDCIISGNYAPYLIEDEPRREHIDTRSGDDLLAAIEAISRSADVTAADRTRNLNLIGLMKSYCINAYAQNGELRCECCGEPTFEGEGGEPYVEFHHLIPFKTAYGPDHRLNLVALCPNCHRKFHYIRSELKSGCYASLERNNYLHMTLADRLRELRRQNLIRSYHLEFLLAENAISAQEYDLIAA